jgi:hypothetical protein
MWIGGLMENAFWALVDQKWKDSLNMAAAEAARWVQGTDHCKGVEAMRKGEPEKQAAEGTTWWGLHGHS